MQHNRTERLRTFEEFARQREHPRRDQRREGEDDGHARRRRPCVGAALAATPFCRVAWLVCVVWIFVFVFVVCFVFNVVKKRKGREGGRLAARCELAIKPARATKDIQPATHAAHIIRREGIGISLQPPPFFVGP